MVLSGKSKCYAGAVLAWANAFTTTGLHSRHQTATWRFRRQSLEFLARFVSVPRTALSVLGARA